MAVRIGVGSWRRCRNHDYRGVLAKDLSRHSLKCRGCLTPCEDELEFDQLHVCEIGIGRLVEDSHPHVLHLSQISLQRVLQSVLEFNELRDLDIGLVFAKGHCEANVPVSTSPR